MDPNQDYNPFSHPSAIEANRQQQQATTASFPNSFDDEKTQPIVEHPVVQKTLSPVNVPLPQSTQYQTNQNAFGDVSNNTFADSEYQRQVLELRRREEDLANREKELFQQEQDRLRNSVVKAKNFPPLPKWCPIKPCFFIDIRQEINPQYVKLVKSIQYYWYAYCATIFINFIAACCYAGANGDESILHVILSIILGVLFIFLCFYVQFFAAYKAISRDSHFNYVMYFVSTAIAIVVNLIQVIGVKGSGWCGIIIFAYLFDKSVSIPGGIFGIIATAGFIGCAVLNVIQLKKVHNIYRTGSRGTIQQTATSAFASNVTPYLFNAPPGGGMSRT